MTRVRSKLLLLALAALCAAGATGLCACGVDASIEDIDICALPVVGADESAFVEIESLEEAGDLGELLSIPSDAYEVAFALNETDGILEASFMLDDDSTLKDDDDSYSTVWRSYENGDNTVVSTTPFVVRVNRSDEFVNNSGQTITGSTSSATAAARTQNYYRVWNEDGQGLCCWYNDGAGYSFSIYTPYDCQPDYLTLMAKITIAGADSSLR